MRNRIVTGALLLLVLLAVLGAMLNGLPAQAAGMVALPAQTVPLGMATDHARQRYWVLENSSGRLALSAYTADGTAEGGMYSTDSLINAQALAWVGGYAYVGDIGGSRSGVTVYQVREPWPGTEILKAVAFPLAYPDGEHDAAAMFVDARQRVHLVTTGPQAGIYRAPATPEPGVVAPLERVADAPDGVTDAAALRDGRVVLRTSAAVITVDATSFAAVAEAPIIEAQQGHALAESLDAGEVLTASGAEGRVTAVPVPGPAAVIDEAPPTQDPADAQRPGFAARLLEQPGTVAALVAALVVAVLAGIVVLTRR